jgi:hypothetical protein
MGHTTSVYLPLNFISKNFINLNKPAIKTTAMIDPAAFCEFEL